MRVIAGPSVDVNAANGGRCGGMPIAIPLIVFDVRLPVMLPILKRLIEVVLIVMTNTYQSLRPYAKGHADIGFPGFLVSDRNGSSLAPGCFRLQLRDGSMHSELITVGLHRHDILNTVAD